jgi:hypothetical protein
MTVVCVIGLALLVITIVFGCSGFFGSSDKIQDWSGQFTGYSAITEKASGNRGQGR